jgi:hypothetical protein
MTRRLLLMAGVLSVALAPCAARSQSADELKQLDELDAACTQAREAKIREVQQQKIEECVKEPAADRAEPKSRADCERYWGDYGWTEGTASGGTRPHLYADLPECVRAFEARQKYQSR